VNEGKKGVTKRKGQKDRERRASKPERKESPRRENWGNARKEG